MTLKMLSPLTFLALFLCYSPFKVLPSKHAFTYSSHSLYTRLILFYTPIGQAKNIYLCSLLFQFNWFNSCLPLAVLSRLPLGEHHQTYTFHRKPLDGGNLPFCPRRYLEATLGQRPLPVILWVTGYPICQPFQPVCRLYRTLALARAIFTSLSSCFNLYLGIRSLDLNSNRYRPFLYLQNNHIVIVEQVFRRGLIQLHPRNNTHRQERYYNIYLVIRQAVTP